MKKILIATATFNESNNIIILLHQILKINFKLDILIIDDNSPDNTSLIVKELMKKNKRISLIKRKKKYGLDSAHKIMYNYAVKNSYNFLITMDADLSHDPKIIPIFLKYINKYDCVIGSRYIKGGKNKLTGFRYYLSKYGNKLIKFLLKSEINEFTTSYRCFDIKKLKKFNFNQINSKGYSFFMNVIYLIYRQGYSIKEIPIIFYERKSGKSKIPKIEIIRTLINLLKLKF